MERTTVKAGAEALVPRHVAPSLVEAAAWRAGAPCPVKAAADLALRLLCRV